MILITRLFPNLSQELNDKILMYLSSDDIHNLYECNVSGRIVVSEYVWLRKKDRTIREAIRNGNLVGLKYLYEASVGKDVTYIQANYSYVLQLGARSGHIDVVKYIVQHMTDTYTNYRYALEISVTNGYLDIVKYLVDCDADSASDKGRTYNNNTLLRLSAATGHLEIVRYFVENLNVDFSATCDSALRVSIENGHLEIVRYLIERNDSAYASYKVITHANALMLSAAHGHLSIVKYLVELGANINAYNFWMASNWNYSHRLCNNGNALQLSAIYGNLDVVKYLVECGADIIAHNINALILAIQYNHLEVVKYLVEYSGINICTNNVMYYIKMNGYTLYNYNSGTMLFPNLSCEINEQILLYLNSDDIHYLHNLRSDQLDYNLVPEYVWLRKKDRTIEEAALNSNLIGIKYLIENQNTCIKYNLALQLSASLGNLDIIKYLVDIAGTSDKVEIHEDRDSALFISADNGHLNVVKYLIEYDATIGNNYYDSDEARANIYEEALVYSAENGHLEVVKYLVDQWFVCQNMDIDINEALQMGAKNGHLEIVKYLIHCGTDINDASSDNDNDDTTLKLSAENGHLEVVKYLVENGANDDNALFYSAKHGHLEVVKYLMGYTSAHNCSRALRIATLNDHPMVVKYLVDNGVVVNDYDYDYDLQLNASKGNLEVVKIIIENCKSIACTHGESCIRACNIMSLHYSIEKEHLEIAKYLIDNGASEYYALIKSAFDGNLEFVKYLVERGSVGCKTMRQYANMYDTFLEPAIKNGHLDVVKYLIEYRANNISYDGDNCTIKNYLLYYGVRNGHLEIVKYLIHCGADINIALQSAIRHSRLDIVRYLIEYKNELDTR